MNLSTKIDLNLLLPLAIYFSILFALGLKAFRKTKNFSDYILGSRKLGPIIGALNVGASDMSSWLLMGLPAAFYLNGLNQIWMVLGLVLGSYLSWKILAQKIRRLSEFSNNSLTISSFLENYFNDKTGLISVTTSLIIIFFFTIYIASGFVGSAKLFAEVFAISYHQALIISAILIISYAFLGGFLAVSWADLFQGLLMLAVLLLVPAFTIFFTNFSLTNFVTLIKQNSPQHFDPFYNLSFGTLAGYFAWGLGYFGQPHIISKYMALKNESEIPLARKICIWWMSLAMLGAAIVGILGFAYFFNQPLKEPETVFIKICQEIFHPAMIGILIAAILAAIMSTLNSQIIICCAALAQDFYQRFFRKSAKDKELLFVTRFSLLLIAIAAILIASNEKAKILELVSHAWAGLGAGLGPTILFTIFYRKTSKIAAICGMISGSFGAIFFSYFPIFSYEILPAFLLSCCAIFLISSTSQIAKAPPLRN